MDIQEMHILFRQLGQQMGMQTIRALTPEQIDTLINSSIKDVLSQVVQSNIIKSTDNVSQTQDNYKLGPINSLGSLYRRQEIDLVPPAPDTNQDGRIFQLIVNKGIDKMTTKFYRYKPSSSSSISTIAEYFYIVAFNLIYDKPAQNVIGYTGIEDTDNSFGYVQPAIQGIGRKIPVDIIDEAKIFECFQDEYLKPKITHPCIVMFDDNQFDLYMGNFIKNSTNTYRLEYGILPKTLVMSYIGIPAKVHKGGGTDPDVNSDMPIHLHELIVKHAVDLWIKTLSKVPFAASTQTQNNNQ